MVHGVNLNLKKNWKVFSSLVQLLMIGGWCDIAASLPLIMQSEMKLCLLIDEFTTDDAVESAMIDRVSITLH